MASESSAHTHQWQENNDVKVMRCTICRAWCLQGVQRGGESVSEQRFAQARALLEDVLACVPRPNGYGCRACGAAAVSNEAWNSNDPMSEAWLVPEHAPDCPIANARAFLAQHKE